MKVLVTGATGNLGSRLVPALVTAGYSVRALSRQPRASGDLEWVQGDLRTGDGIRGAVDGVDAIVHAATDGGFTEGKAQPRKAFIHSPKTDVDGTAHLLDAAKAAGVGRMTYVSIVGLDRVPMSYYKHKLQAEDLVRSSGLPFTIARITQFHSLIDGLCRFAVRLPIALLPLRSRYQPIDERDAASLLAGLLGRDSAGREFVEFGGPEDRTLGELADAWREARGVRKRIRNLPLPGFPPGLGGKPIEEGALCTKDHSGTITWEQWLKETAAR